MKKEILENEKLDAFSQFSKSIEKFDRLSDEEVIDLFHQISLGNHEAKTTLLLHHLKFLIYMAKVYKVKTEMDYFPLLDLIQEGYFGLNKAIDTFDLEKNLRFLSYASIVIFRTIARSNDVQRNIVIQEKAKMNVRNYRKFVAEYEKKGIPLSDEIICRELNISECELNNIKKAASITQSSIDQIIDSPSSREGYYSVEDFLPSFYDSIQQKIDEMDNRRELLLLKQYLGRKDYYLLYYSVFGGKRHHELAKQFGLTRQAISLQLQHILKKTYDFLKNPELQVKVTRRMYQKYGTDFDKLNEKPIELEDIITYSYIENQLTDEERVIYYYAQVEKLKYTNLDYSKILGLSLEEYQEVYQSLKKKLASLLECSNSYSCYKNHFIQDYHLDLFQYGTMKSNSIREYVKRK